nr:hypothetical protein [uncultured Mucilaginibacter sp.]
MLKCTIRLLIIFCTAAVWLSSCKLDAPVYPDKGLVPDTVDTDTIPPVVVDDGTNPPTDATYTIPIGAVNTIVFQVDGGETVTLEGATADVSPVGSVATSGYTSLLAGQPDPEISVQLNFSNIIEGEYANDLLGLIYQGLKLSDDGSGKVKATTFKKIGNSYHIRGYFKVNATNDNDGIKHMVVGSFNIAQ